MGWYQHASQHLAMAGLGALLRLATTLAALRQRQQARAAVAGGVGGGAAEGGAGSDEHWALLLDMVAAAAKEDVATVVSLARQQATAAWPAEGGGSGGGPASAVPPRLFEGAAAMAAGGGGGGASQGGSPRSPAAYVARMQQQLGGSPHAGARNPAFGSAPGSGGDRSRRSSTAAGLGGGAASPAAGRGLGDASARTLHVRARQLVLLERALGEMHARCLGELTWDVQMRLLGVLGDTVAAAMAFNAEAAARRLQHCGGAGSGASAGARGPASAPPSAPGAGMASAPSGTSSISAAGLVEQQQQQQPGSAGAHRSEASSAGQGLGSGSLPNSVGPSAQPSLEIEAAEAPDGGAAAAPAASASSGGMAGGARAAPSANPFEPPGESTVGASSSGAGAGSGSGLRVATRISGSGGGGSPTKRQQLPELLVTSVESSEVVGLALMRLEVEGGTQLILVRRRGLARHGRLHGGCRALRLVVAWPRSVGELVYASSCILVKATSQPTVMLPSSRFENTPVPGHPMQGLRRSLESGSPDAIGARAARGWLHRLCREIISAEADCSTGAAAAAAAAALSQKQQQQHGGGGGAWDNPMRDVLCGTSWEHAVRVPLVIAALDVLRGMSGEDLRAEMAAAFPALARLVCSNHAPLRSALARLMAAPQVVALVTTAAAASVVV
jgi:hypothetical protein